VAAAALMLDELVAVAPAPASQERDLALAQPLVELPPG
jgi:hypothetical protein